jgi:hypothetical protein
MTIIQRTTLRLLILALALGVSSIITAQSRLERHRDQLHRAIDCDADCDIDWATWAAHRSSEFTVRLSFREQPISGVRVTLTSEDPLPDGSGRHVMTSSNTNYDGVAEFSGIPAGKYIAHVNEGLLAQSQDVEVEMESTSTAQLRLEWPLAPIATRNVRGWLTAWQRMTPQNHSHRLPLPDVQVQLFDLRSGKLLESTRTAGDGYYEFPDSGDGLYVIRVSEGQYPSMRGYDEAVEVASNAIREHMPGLVVDQVCGSGLAQLDERTEMQEPCVPAGAADPVPPFRRYESYRPYFGPTVVIVQQQIVIVR